MCVLCDLWLRTHDLTLENANASRVGSVVLAAYLNRRWDVASIAIEVLRGSFGMEGLRAAVALWCDIVLERTLPCKRPAPVHLVWEEIITGRVVPAQQVSPSARWAGQVLAARAADDEDNFNALISALPADTAGLRRYTGALLQALALQLGDLGNGGAG